MLLSQRRLMTGGTPLVLLAAVLTIVVSSHQQCSAEDAKPAATPAATPAAAPATPAAEEEEEEEDTGPPPTADAPPAPVPKEPKSTGTPEDIAKIAAFRGDYHFVKADKLFKQHVFLKAAVEFREALKNQPKNIQYAEKLAEAAVQARNYQMALQGYESILKNDPARKKDIARQQADAYFNLKQLDAACEKYKIASEFATDKGEVWKTISTIRLSQGKNDEAAAALRQALRADPKDSKTYNKLAQLLMSGGKTSEAFGVYRDGVRNLPRDGDLQEGYAYSLMTNKDYRGAAAAYKQAAMLKGSTEKINAGYQAAMKYVEYEEQVARQKAEQAAREEAKAKKKRQRSEGT